MNITPCSVKALAISFPCWAVNLPPNDSTTCKLAPITQCILHTTADANHCCVCVCTSTMYMACQRLKPPHDRMLFLLAFKEMASKDIANTENCLSRLLAESQCLQGVLTCWIERALLALANTFSTASIIDEFSFPGAAAAPPPAFYSKTSLQWPASLP